MMVLPLTARALRVSRNLESSARVQPRGHLIKEQNRRIGQHLYSQRRSGLLSSRTSLMEIVAYPSIGAILQSKL